MLYRLAPRSNGREGLVLRLVWDLKGLGFRGLGFRGFVFWGLGVYGFRGLEFIGSRVLRTIHARTHIHTCIKLVYPAVLRLEIWVMGP